MKIGVICYPTQGGSGVVATEIGHEMAQAGHEVHVISYATPFRFQTYMENFKFHEVEVSAYPLFRYPPYDIALANTVMEVAEREGLDLIHAHYAIPHSISAHLAREMLEETCGGIKIVTTLHGTDVTIVGQERGYTRITRFGLMQSDAVTTVSRDLARETEQVFGKINKELEVIPNFVDTERFHQDCCPDKRALLALKNERILMHLSNFRDVKRPLDVVRAFARVAKDYNVRLIMLGEGPLQRDCKELAHKLGVADHVRFLGNVDKPWELLPQADAFMLPSEHESFGLAALEAMACGVPVIAARTGGLPEVVTHGETGFLCEVGDIDAYAEALATLFKDDAAQLDFGARARARAVTEFSKDRIVPRWEAFYQRVIGQPVSESLIAKSS